MSHEIYYTSAPEGLKPGTSGFCTVAASDNIPKALWDRLETLSAYRHQFGAGGAPNPVSHAHWILNIAGKTHHVLSRICDSGVDHTQRTNAFAHHLVLEPADIAAAQGGPAWLLEQPGVMMDRWNGQVGALRPSRLAQGDIFAASRVCHAWAAATGDAGWGGLLADVFAKVPTRPVCILFGPGQDVLPLIAEAIALLPPAARWNVTFNTYFTSMPTSATCLWRCCLAGTQAAQTGLRYAAGGLVLDLTDRSRLPALPAGPYVTMARTGQAAEAPRPAAKTTQPTLAELKNKAGLKAKPGYQPPVFDPEGDAEERDTERRRERTFDFAPPPEPDRTRPPLEDSSYDLREEAPVGARGAVPKGPGRMMRRAEEALEESEREAARAARRRRKQVLWLFVGALGAIALGCGLVFMAGRSGAPPEPRGAGATYRATRPVDTTPIFIVETEPATVQTTVATTQAPATVVATTQTPATIVASQTRPVYPEKLEFTTALLKPTPKGLTNMQWQQLALPADTLDPLPVTGLRLAFFARQADQPVAAGAATYTDKVLGTLTAEPDDAKKGVRISWKPPGGSGKDILFVALDQAKKQVEMQWTLDAKNLPAASNFVFWTLQNSALVLESPRETKQKILLKPLALKPLVYTGTQPQPWPADLPELPAGVAMAALPGLPPGWTAANVTADKNPQISFTKPTSVLNIDPVKNPSVNALFLLTFKPGSGGGPATVESTYAAALKQTRDDLTTAQKELDDINKKVDSAAAATQVVGDGGGTFAKLKAQQEEARLLVNACAAAVAAYNELNEFDISFDLADKMRLATLHFQRTKAP